MPRRKTLSPLPLISLRGQNYYDVFQAREVVETISEAQLLNPHFLHDVLQTTFEITEIYSLTPEYWPVFLYEETIGFHGEFIDADGCEVTLPLELICDITAQSFYEGDFHDAQMRDVCAFFDRFCCRKPAPVTAEYPISLTPSERQILALTATIIKAAIDPVAGEWWGWRTRYAGDNDNRP